MYKELASEKSMNLICNIPIQNTENLDRTINAKKNTNPRVGILCTIGNLSALKLARHGHKLTFLPSIQVSLTLILRISAGGVLRGFLSRITRSACLPTSRLPTMLSANTW